MAIRSNGARTLSSLERGWFGIVGWLRRIATPGVVVQDRQYSTRFVCDNAQAAYRAVSLWTKEEGTMAWLDGQLRPGDRFLDVGANVGIYTLAAAHRVGPQGRVYAVEPNKPNAVALMQNVAANGFQDRIDVIAIPLTDAREIAAFNYTSLKASESGSQFGSTVRDGQGQSFVPVVRELCLGVSVDELLDSAAIQPPDLVKIDVDGIEHRILVGMARLLTAARRPRSVQVELNVGEHEAIEGLMASYGYKLDHRHLTAIGMKRKAAGVPMAQIAHNAVFVPAG